VGHKNARRDECYVWPVSKCSWSALVGGCQGSDSGFLVLQVRLFVIGTGL